MRYTYVSLILILSCIGLLACSDEHSDKAVTPTCVIGDDCFTRDTTLLNVDNISEAGGLLSHNFGKNCASCHQEHGPGKGLFVVSGSLYKDASTPWVDGASIRLFADKARTQLVSTIQADSQGNFYSTASIEVPDAGLYVSVFDKNEQKLQDMNSPKISFACNMCHSGNNKVIVKLK